MLHRAPIPTRGQQTSQINKQLKSLEKVAERVPLRAYKINDLGYARDRLVARFGGSVKQSRI